MLTKTKHTKKNTADFNKTRAAYPHDKTLYQLFEEKVLKIPNNIAISYENIKLTYKELNEKANQLAHYLRILGVKENITVALSMNRSIDTIISIIAILKAGGVYVPLDPIYPKNRLIFMLEDSGASILLTDSSVPYIFDNFRGQVLYYDVISSKILNKSIDNLPFENNANNLSYVIYTSGTTGQPKGVALPHRTIVNLIYWQTLDRNNSKNTILKVAQFANFSFDVSIQEIGYTFINGYTLCMVPSDIRKLPTDYAKFIISEGINTIYITTSMLELISSAMLELNPKVLKLQEIFVSGEILKINTIIKTFFEKYPNITLINQYGPSESHVMLSYTLPQNIEAWEVFPPLGKCISNYCSYVLDCNLKPLNIGEIGELYISGVGLSRGYINRDSLTSNKFIRNPFSKEKFHEVLYSTGDLVKRLSDGNLQYVGRNDFQVKIRGYRIEIQEIENILLNYYNKVISQSVVVVKSHNISDNDNIGSENKYLVAYYVSDTVLDKQKLIDYLHNELPEYMVPNFFVHLTQLPLTENGKLDVKALPDPEFTDSNNYVLPRNELETILCGIWSKVLCISKSIVGIYDNFFQLGGNSILAIKLVSGINKELNINISALVIFKYNTIDALATYLKSYSPKNNNITIRQNYFKNLQEQILSFAQARLFFIEQYEDGSNAYNIPMIYCISKHVKIDILENSIKSIVYRHEILRTIIQEDKFGNQYQLVLDDKKYPIIIKRIKVLDKTQLHNNLEQDIFYIYDLTKEYPIKVSIYILDNNYYLSIIVHHIAFDGWSVDIFLRELQEYYKYYLGCSQGLLNNKIDLPRLIIQYKDFALWQRDYLKNIITNKQLNYWQNKLKGYETLFLITDRSRPENVKYTGAYENFELTINTSMALRKVAKELKVSLYSLLLSAYYLMLRIYSNQDDIVIGTPISNRHYNHIEHLIGFFVNTLALRIKINSQESLQEFIQKVGNEVVEAQFNQDLPFDEIVKQLNVAKDTSRHPIFQVMFGVHSFGGGLFDGISKESIINLEDQTTLKGYKEGMALYTVAKFDITTVINDNEDRLTGFFNYAVSLYDSTTIKQFIETYIYVLTQISKLDFVSKNINYFKVIGLSYLDTKSYDTIVNTWNYSDIKYDNNINICDIFQNQVDTRPNSIAISYENIKLTYKELNEKANQLAHYLKQVHKVRSNTSVGVFLDRSEYMIIAIFAILKTGASYVPIDPDYPNERVLHILDDASITIILTIKNYIEKLKSINNFCFSKIALALDSHELKKSLFYEIKTNLKLSITGKDCAYLMYTSGTTGKPKGVIVTHNGVVGFCYKNNYCIINKYTITLGYSNYVFDGSIFDIFTTLLNGGQLVIIDKSSVLDESHLRMFLTKYSVNTMFLTTALFVYYSKFEVDNPLYLLNNLLFGGEKIDYDDLKRFLIYNSNNTNLIHVYGPTENIVFSTYCNLNLYRKKIVPIGKKLSDKKLYVLNKDLKPLPVRAIGELYIGGNGIAQGYLNEPVLTKQKFIINPFQTLQEKDFNENTKLYKTGDLVYWLSDGNLQYVGRNDLQVKIRGHRIELKEIENAILKHSLSSEVVVLIKDENKDKKLIAYLAGIHIVDDYGIKEETERLRMLLRQKLPNYMIPDFFIFLDKMPINTSGKIDRNILSRFKVSSEKSDTLITHSSCDDYENTLLDIWKIVLKKDNISVHDNFFDLGGHSLLLAQMYSMLPQYIKKKLKIVDLFKYSTINTLSNFLKQKVSTENTTFNIKTEKSRFLDNSTISNNSHEIAVIGMAGRFPGSNNIEDFWQNLKIGKDCITHYSKEELFSEKIPKSLLDNPYYVRAQSTISDIRSFDAELFGYSPDEASIIDPQQRLFLQCAWNALENSGYNNPKAYYGDIGVYASIGMNRYLIDNLSSLKEQDYARQFQIMTGNLPDFLSTRVAYKLNLTGPAVTIQTACSSSLVALHHACIALQVGDCNIALAGGVSLQSLKKEGYLYQPHMISSPDGKCRAFDAKANGTIGGQGVAIVVLKRLSQAIKDQDHIYAVIKGSAINNDGYNKIGFTAPSPIRQKDVIRKAQEKAGVKAESITYVEAHGTGTLLGDPIEIDALNQAFQSNTKEFCAIGSVKTNIGHLDTASGITGFIKAVLCLYYKTLVPTINYNTPNPKINFKSSPFYVNTKLKKWETNKFPRRAGVSSFGVGGTNSHVILEEFVSNNDSLVLNKSISHQLISLSAHTLIALEKKISDLIIFLQKYPNTNLECMAYTFHVGHYKLKYNKFFIGNTFEDIILALKNSNNTYIEQSIKPIVFMFPGQGSQYKNMGKQLYESEPYFKMIIDKCINIMLNDLMFNIKIEDVFGTNEQAIDQIFTQPSLFIIEYALAQYLIHLGIKPNAMIGHSIGEYVAACIAGVFSLKDALILIIERSKLIQGLPEGQMLAISLSSQEVSKYLVDKDLDIAVINSVDSCVVSGPKSFIEKLKDELNNKSIACQLLKVSHALHSRMLEPILNEFYNVINKIQFFKPSIPFISNITGNWINNHITLDSKYWVDHLRCTVNFSSGLLHLTETLNLKNSILLEVGPNQVLTNIVRRSKNKNIDSVFPCMRRFNEIISDYLPILNVLGYLWSIGIKIDWNKFYKKNRCRIPLPEYPFNNNKYWVSSSSEIQNIQEAYEDNKVNNDNLINENNNNMFYEKDIKNIVLSVLKELLGLDKININEDFFSLGGDSLLAIRICTKIGKILNIELRLQEILENSIISKLIKLITQKVESLKLINLKQDWSSIIVKLKDGDKKQKLFLIHPIGGYVLCYRDLVNCITESYDVYGIQCPYFEDIGELANLKTIESIASYYIKAMESIQSEGPYWLVGASLGGIIAFEMAQQLSNNNKNVSLLGMIDSVRPDHTLIKSYDSDEFLLNIIKLFCKDPISLDQFKQLSELNQIKMLVNSMNLHDLDFVRQKQVFNQITLYCKAIINYSTKYYNGKILFFNAEEKFSEYDNLSLDTTWKGFAKKMTTYTISGDHMSMIAKHNVSTLVKILESYIKFEINP